MLPEKLETAELSAGNALVEGATFLAILIGTIAGGIAVAEAKSAELVVGVIMALAVASWAFAQLIPVAGPAAPGLVITRNPWTSTVALLRELRLDRRLWSGAHIVSWFWLVGFVALSLLPALVKTGLGGSEGVVTTCLAVFTVGIAIGSGLAAWREPRPAQPVAGAAGCAADGALRTGHRRGCLDFRPGAGAHRSQRTPRLGRRPGSADGACAGLPSPAGSSSCRRSRPCRPGHPSIGALA